MSLSVTDLADHFQTKLTNLKNCIALSSAKGEPGCRALMNNIDSDLREMQILLTLMRTNISQRKEAINGIKEMKIKLNELENRVNYADKNLPARLPKFTPPPPVAPKPTRSDGDRQAVNKQETKPPKSDRTHHSSTSSLNAGAAGGRTRRPSTADRLAALPSASYLTMDEFNSIPKYMRGRISYEQVNTAVDEINKGIRGKYEIIFTPKSAVNDLVRRRIKEFKEMETKETKGVRFVVDSDLYEHSRFKLDATGRSIMTMLRHCGRIREIRGNGLLRYAICEIN